MKTTLATSAALAVLFSTQAMGAPIGGFGDGGAALQGVLNGITTAPNPGVSSVNVNTDNLSDDLDSNWAINGGSSSVSTIIVELAGFANQNRFGIYDAADPSKTVEIFAGPDGAGASKLLSITNTGAVWINFAPTGIVFAGNCFGFFLDSSANQGGGFFYSNTSLNADGQDHMVAYQGTGVDEISVPPFAAGPWSTNQFILAFEDLYGDNTTSDRDFTDFVVQVESITPKRVPEGGTAVAMFGLSLIGIGAVRRKFRK
jgi:hypothetical protein